MTHPTRLRVDGEQVELGGERVTYRQLWDRAARVAGGLRAAGVQPGDRVANRLPNGNDWVYAFWGTLLAGAQGGAPGRLGQGAGIVAGGAAGAAGRIG